MSELLRVDKRKMMKEILKKIHEGEDVERLKEEFEDLLKSISPLEIPVIEQELVREGISPRDIARLCDLHVELLRGKIERNVDLSGLVPGHPLHTLVLENERIVKDAETLSLYSGALKNSKGEIRKSIYEGLISLLREMRMIGRTHYSKEEMLIFPYLERRGITAVPTVLWTKHDEIRAKISGVLKHFEYSKVEENPDLFEKHTRELSSMLVDMVYRENNIFYPTVRFLMSEGEWLAVKLQEDEYGHYKVKPGSEWRPSSKPIYPYEVKEELSAEALLELPPEVRRVLKDEDIKPDEHEFVRDGDLELENGYLNLKELNALLNTLPVDVTFVDSEDRVRYFSGGKRIFNRSRNILGRPVQLCHPPKSVHIVNRILEAFKKGEKESAEFWIDVSGRKIYIRYLPVRDEEGNYLGTLEVTQDITDLQNLRGEKRLLDWE